MTTTMGAGTAVSSVSQSKHGAATANNSTQTIAHGCTATPTYVYFSFAGTAHSGKAWEYATADATSIYVATVGTDVFTWYAEV